MNNHEKLKRDFFERCKIASQEIDSFLRNPEENYIFYRDISVFLRVALLDDKKHKTKCLIKRFFNDDKIEFAKIRVVNDDIGWDENTINFVSGNYQNLPTGSFQFQDPLYFTNNGIKNFLADEGQSLDEWLNTKSLFCGCVSPLELIQGTCDKEGAHADESFCKIIDHVDSHFVGLNHLRIRHIVLFYIAHYVLNYIDQRIKFDTQNQYIEKEVA